MMKLDSVIFDCSYRGIRYVVTFDYLEGEIIVAATGTIGAGSKIQKHSMNGRNPCKSHVAELLRYRGEICKACQRSSKECSDGRQQCCEQCTHIAGWSAVNFGRQKK